MQPGIHQKFHALMISYAWSVYHRRIESSEYLTDGIDKSFHKVFHIPTISLQWICVCRGDANHLLMQATLDSLNIPS